MKAKDLIIDFINLIFALALVAFIMFYFVVGDRFSAFVQLLESLIPIGIYGMIFLIMINIKRVKLKREVNEGNEDTEITLHLNYLDKLKADILVFLMPIIILLIAFFVEKVVTAVDVIQASAAFLLMYFWQKILFKRV
jgi:hypothetical protein